MEGIMRKLEPPSEVSAGEGKVDVCICSSPLYPRIPTETTRIMQPRNVFNLLHDSNFCCDVTTRWWAVSVY